MNNTKVTPKDFFLWAGAMVSLYVSVTTFITLLFSYLDYAYPDSLAYYAGDPYANGASYEMAALIVLVPLFLVLMRTIRKSIAADPTREETWVRRWALYLTLFVAGAAIAADLITLIMYFFNGDVTVRFVLKVFIVLGVAGAGFLHFLADLRGFWKAHASQSRLVGSAAGLLVVCAIIAGFFIIGTPWQARLYRYDEQKVSDLQQIQYQLISYWQSKQALPSDLGALNDPYSGFSVPTDPQSGSAYEYQSTTTLAFELCASFNAPTRANSLSDRGVTTPYPVGAITKGDQTDYWAHEAGRVCFYRTIDPQLYPQTVSKK